MAGHAVVVKRHVAALYSGFITRRHERERGRAGRSNQHTNDERWVTTFAEAGA